MCLRWEEEMNEITSNKRQLSADFLFFGVPVVWCGESRHHYVSATDVNNICHSLQDVEVEVGVARDGAIQARLEKWGPLLLQDARRAATVILTHPRHPRKHHLMA